MTNNYDTPRQDEQWEPSTTNRDNLKKDSFFLGKCD